MPAVYGNDFASLGLAADRDRQLQDAQMEAAINHLMVGAKHLQDQRNANRDFAFRQQQYQDNLKQQGVDNSFRQHSQDMSDNGSPWQRMQYGDALDQRDFSNSMQIHNENRADQQAADNYNLQQEHLALQKRAQVFSESAGNPQLNRQQEFFENDAKQAAARGAFGTPDDVQALYGGKINPAMVNALAAQSLQARQQIASQHRFAAAAAATANENDAITSHAAKIKDWSNFVPGHGHWGTQGAESAPPELQRLAKDANGKYLSNGDFLKALAQRQAIIAPQVGRINANKSFAELIEQDPETGKYVPTTTAPAWMTQQSRPVVSPQQGQPNQSQPWGDTYNPDGGNAQQQTPPPPAQVPVLPPSSNGFGMSWPGGGWSPSSSTIPLSGSAPRSSGISWPGGGWSADSPNADVQNLPYVIPPQGAKEPQQDNLPYVIPTQPGNEPSVQLLQSRQPATAGGMPVRPGTKKAQNGFIYQFDGRQWQPIGSASQ